MTTSQWYDSCTPHSMDGLSGTFWIRRSSSRLPRRCAVMLGSRSITSSSALPRSSVLGHLATAQCIHAHRVASGPWLRLSLDEAFMNTKSP